MTITKCDACKGSGEQQGGPGDGAPCRKCGGSGRMEETRDRNPFPKKAWALVHYGPEGHVLEFANGFGIYPTRDEAESYALDYNGVYKVVRVEINHHVHRGDQCPACATGSTRRTPEGGLRCANCGWTGVPATTE